MSFLPSFATALPPGVVSLPRLRGGALRNGSAGERVIGPEMVFLSGITTTFSGGGGCNGDFGTAAAGDLDLRLTTGGVPSLPFLLISTAGTDGARCDFADPEADLFDSAV